MPRVIVNTTPLVLLGNVGKLDLFKSLYKQIIIPHAVYEEVIKVDDQASQIVRSRPEWLLIENAPSLENQPLFKAKLHAGEIEVISLALNQQNTIVVLDDKAARQTAKYLGLTVTGTLGLLLRAKERGYIPEIKPIINEFNRNGFRVNSSIIDEVLRLAGEQ